MNADNTYLLDLYNELRSELDGYSMNMGALLLKQVQFDVDPQSGRLNVGDGIKRACESRRGRIRQLVTHLLSPPALGAEASQALREMVHAPRKALLITLHRRYWDRPRRSVTVGTKDDRRSWTPARSLGNVAMRLTGADTIIAAMNGRGATANRVREVRGDEVAVAGPRTTRSVRQAQCGTRARVTFSD